MNPPNIPFFASPLEAEPRIITGAQETVIIIPAYITPADRLKLNDAIKDALGVCVDSASYCKSQNDTTNQFKQLGRYDRASA